jgi:hypothetical protein
MYWGALSTDIKKSSVNWNGLPSWMEKAVQYHNTVLETCVLYHRNNYGNGTTVELLPNAPEGDAYAYLFTNSSLSDLKQFVISLGIDIQGMLHELRMGGDTKLSVSKCDSLLEALREEEKPLKDQGIKNEDRYKKLYNTYRLFQTKKYYGGIYIRIGIAFSDSPPIPYSFNRYRGAEDGTEDGTPSQSFRSGVITMAEKAEERAEFEYKSHLVKSEVYEGPALKECYMEDGTMKFKDVFEPERKIEQEESTCKMDTIRKELREKADKMKTAVTDALTKKEKELDNPENKAKDVTGFCVFVEYHPVLSDELAIANPYTKTLINKEYIDIHDKADKCIAGFIDEVRTTVDNYYKGGLVKQKRDSTSMFVILDRLNPRYGTTASNATILYSRLAKLLSSLPIGSSIGVAYGDMKEITMTRSDEGRFTDYFQESVNLAARMVMRNWSFSTSWGITDENGNHNRLAFTCKNPKVSSLVESGIKNNTIPFTLENIPLGVLNAGGDDTIVCISSKFMGWKNLKVGDRVTTGQKEGVITKDMGDTFEIRYDDITKIVSRSEIHLTNKVDEIDGEAFKTFKGDMKPKPTANMKPKPTANIKIKL